MTGDRFVLQKIPVLVIANNHFKSSLFDLKIELKYNIPKNVDFNSIIFLDLRVLLYRYF